jgi:CHAD domain-containing protein
MSRPASARTGQEFPARKLVRFLSAISRQARHLPRESGTSLDERIHGVRLLIKQTRALLWLIRLQMANSTADAIKADLRQAAQLLAGNRDRLAVQTALHRSARAVSKKGDQAVLEEAGELFANDHPQPRFYRRELQKKLRSASRILAKSVDSFRRVIGQAPPDLSLFPRLAKARKTVRKAGKKVRRTNRAPDFHLWRKRVKRLLAIEKMIVPNRGKKTRRRWKTLDKLQNRLGVHHDLVLVSRVINSS